MNTKKSYQDWKTTAAKVDWAAEIERTLAETGWTKVQLAEALGLYIQPRSGNNGGPVSPHIYTWMRGKHQPKFYLLYALRYLRSQYGQQNAAATVPPHNPTEPVDEH
jgi:hypothetical protein